MADTVILRKTYILYGSQTGNAESLAVDLSERLGEIGVVSQCMALNAAKTISLKEVASLLVILCSTTGNGDAPENADGWWRTIKLRSAAKDMFEGVPFSVLGLGDTNYDKYCYMGKAIDKRLEELGGTRVLPIYCADEGTGMEETVEAWKTAVFDVAQSMAAVAAVAAAGSEDKGECP